MAGNPDVVALLEEMLDSGRTPEEVCRDCPELLPRGPAAAGRLSASWTGHRGVVPGPGDTPACRRLVAVPHPAELPQRPRLRDAGRCWAAAAWASSTRPGSCASTALVALKMILAGGHAGAGRSWRASAPRPRRSPGCSTPTSCRSTRSASTDGPPFFALEFCRGRQPGRASSPARRCRRGRRPQLVETLAEAVHAAHERASSTATSSRPTSC